MNAYLIEQVESRKVHGTSNVFEKPEIQKGYTQIAEENDEFKYIQMIPPPRVKIPEKEFIRIVNLP